MPLRLTRWAAWAAVAAIIFVTLGRLQDRPSVSQDPQLERSFAYLVLGALFALAYPQRRAVVVIGVVACAFGLEIAQRLTPDRHGEVADAIAKGAGGVLGVLLVDVGHRTATRLKRHDTNG